MATDQKEIPSQSVTVTDEEIISVFKTLGENCTSGAELKDKKWIDELITEIKSNTGRASLFRSQKAKAIALSFLPEFKKKVKPKFKSDSILLEVLQGSGMLRNGIFDTAFQRWFFF